MTGRQGNGAGSRRVTLADVAKASGLSLTQASRALADYADVAAATRGRVRRVAKQLGYRPSQRARTLSMGRQAAVRCAILSVDMPALWLEQSSYGPVLAGILDGTSKEGMDVQFVTLETGRDAGQLAEKLTRFVAEDRADVVVLLTIHALRPEQLEPLTESTVPYVLVNRHFGHLPGAPEVDCVTPDWVGGTRAVVEHLHELGHQDLLALFPKNKTSTTLDHVDGWLAGVQHCGIDPVRAPIVRYEHEAERADPGAIVQRVLRTGLPKTRRRPTAIVAFNDHLAAEVIAAARELDVRVPGDLSVVGFDNTMIAQHVWPALCSYDPHFFQAGQRAVHLLAELVDGPAPRRPRRVMVPVEPICRSSCAPAPRH